MPLTSPQTRYLRGLAHNLKPVLMVGSKGLSAPLYAELEQALEAHELIKVSIASTEREDRQALTLALCKHGHAELVQIIGRISVLYRPARKPKLVLPA